MINRLIGIIYILLKKGTVTAGELAERFEVSTRTIYRDVEHLSMAGIPVYTSKGKNGGISLTEQFVLDKLMVSDEEQQRILTALASLQETGASEEGEILKKLGDFFKAEPVNWVSIDFSDWSGRHKELFEQIRESILGRRVMEFDYYGRYGEMTKRTVEPVQLLFKDYTWYVRAYCRNRNAMRLFKVYRMKRVKVLEEIYAMRNIPLQEPEDQMRTYTEEEMPEVVVWIDGREAYRVYDRFEEEEITRLPDGNFEIRMRYVLDDWVYGMILSFGPSARVIGPEFVREEIARRIGEMKELYFEGE
ncbi:MAG: YafY family transcriptional regulator [Acetatifactor sp.]|nr:YafY family transcriptional regulator [Acetatifactor sp.]